MIIDDLRRDEVVLSKTVLLKIRHDPPTGGVGGWKNKLWGLFYPVRLDKESNKKFNNWTPLLFMAIFQNSTIWQHSRGYPRSVRGWKKGLRGLFNPVRLGQDSKKKFNNWTPGVPNPFVSLFWTNFRKNGFRKNDLSRLRLLSRVNSAIQCNLTSKQNKNHLISIVRSQNL
jgi:hypothetical protein